MCSRIRRRGSRPRGSPRDRAVDGPEGFVQRALRIGRPVLHLVLVFIRRRRFSSCDLPRQPSSRHLIPPLILICNCSTKNVYWLKMRKIFSFIPNQNYKILRPTLLLQFSYSQIAELSFSFAMSSSRVAVDAGDGDGDGPSDAECDLLDLARERNFETELKPYTTFGLSGPRRMV